MPIVPRLKQPQRPGGFAPSIPVFVPVSLEALANSRPDGAAAVVMLHRLRHQVGRWPWTAPPWRRFERRPYDYRLREPMVWSDPPS